MAVADQSDSPREAGWTGCFCGNQTVEVAGKAAFLWLVSHRKGLEFTSGVDWQNHRLFRCWIRWNGRKRLHFE